MSTIRLYQTNRYLTETTAVVTDIRTAEGMDSVATDRSVFFPPGGGQPGDTGTISLNGYAYQVDSVSDDGSGSDIWHDTDAPAGTFSVGDTVTLAIDWSRRFCNMQRHLGEHMLSGTMHTLFGGVNRGFHMGEEYITIDIDLDGRMLTDEELDLAERTVNDAIWADLPVTVTCYDTYEDSLVMPVRKAVPHEGKVWVVTVGDPDDPYDCIACCGTHPASSSEVGLLAIYKCEPNKGMNRIFFDCGSMARDKLAGDSRLLSEIAKRYSCSAASLISRLDGEAEAQAAMRARLSALTSYVKDAEKARMISEIDASGGRSYIYTSELLTVDDLLKLGFSVIEETPDMLLILMHPESNTCLLFSSGDVRCGKYIKEHAPEFGGRGGGRDDNARAVFASTSDMRRFASALAEML